MHRQLVQEGGGGCWPGAWLLPACTATRHHPPRGGRGHATCWWPPSLVVVTAGRPLPAPHPCCTSPPACADAAVAYADVPWIVATEGPPLEELQRVVLHGECACRHTQQGGGGRLVRLAAMQPQRLSFKDRRAKVPGLGCCHCGPACNSSGSVLSATLLRLQAPMAPRSSGAACARSWFGGTPTSLWRGLGSGWRRGTASGCCSASMPCRSSSTPSAQQYSRNGSGKAMHFWTAVRLDWHWCACNQHNPRHSQAREQEPTLHLAWCRDCARAAMGRPQADRSRVAAGRATGESKMGRRELRCPRGTGRLQRREQGAAAAAPPSLLAALLLLATQAASGEPLPLHGEAAGMGSGALAVVRSCPDLLSGKPSHDQHTHTRRVR